MFRKLLFSLIFFSTIVLPQYDKGTIKGLVFDNSSNQVLSNCNIFVLEKQTGTVTNDKGEFELSLSYGEYKIRFSFVGFESVIKSIKLSQRSPSEIITVFLNPKSIEENEVTVFAEKYPSTIVQSIKAKDIQKMPNIYSDPIRTVQIFSGVSTNNELSSSYNVRGGSYDENLVYLNGYEIYRPFLLRSGAEENQSIVNPDMVENLKFFNGAFPAKYGDKMSSALDVNYKKQYNKNISGKVRLDLMNTGVSIAKGNDNYNMAIGLRYANPSLFVNTFQTSGDYRPSFSDIQFLGNYKVTEFEDLESFILYATNKYELIPNTWLGHMKTDRGAEVNQITINYKGNRDYKFNTALTGIKLKSVRNKNIVMKVSLSRYWTEEFENTNLQGNLFYSPDATKPDENKEFIKTRFENNNNSLKLVNYQIKPEINFSKNNNLFSLGADIKFVDVVNNLSENLFEESNAIQTVLPKKLVRTQNYNLNSYSIYNENILRINENFTTNIGFRFSRFNFTEENLFSPRIILTYKTDSLQTFNFSWGYYYQTPFVNELKYRNFDLGTDLKSQRSIHYVFGWQYQFKPKMKFQVETYYKFLDNLYPYYFENIKMVYFDKFVTEGYSYGIDLMFQGELVDGMQSWLGYSYLNSQEKFSNSDEPYRRRLLDQTHTLQIFLQDRIPKRPNWQSHLRFLFGSGFLFNQRRIVSDENTGQSTLSVKFDQPEEYLIYLRVDMGLTAQYEIGESSKINFSAEVLNVFNQYNIAGYEWLQVFSDYNQPLRIPQILSKRFFNIKVEYSF